MYMYHVYRSWWGQTTNPSTAVSRLLGVIMYIHDNRPFQFSKLGTQMSYSFCNMFVLFMCGVLHLGFHSLLSL